MLFSIFLSTLLACGDSTPKETPPSKEEKVEEKKVERPKKDEKPKVETKEEVKVAAQENGADAGKAVYTSVCQQCHQSNGQGIPTLYPPLAGSDWLKKDPDVLIRIVLHGLQGPIKVNGQAYNQAMTPQGNLLSDQKIADALTFVRSSWGNAEAAITVEEVTATREKYKTRTTQWTAAELDAK
jgi:mono/diheme cytochrome c family protein